ncbi:hypothetical protein [Paludibaculum fermentans]|uniref:hypothetical protein n=1 Tax=Paludibaculum fermentans TaxID=1473598 RepID=UPI003EC0E9D9
MPLRIAIRAALVCLLSATGIFSQTMARPAGPAQPPALTALNNAFRAAYSEAKVRILSNAGPTILVNGDNFSLLRDGRRVEANTAVPIYDPVKSIAHIPLAIYVTLTPGDGAIDDARLKSLAALRALIPPAEASLDSLVLSAATLARQKKILAASLSFLDEVAASHTFQRAHLLAFTHAMAQPVLENSSEAARAQLDAIHALVSAWRRDLGPHEFSRLHVVIVGPHMPRENLTVTQYFLRLLHEPAEGGRVVYAEALWDEPKALDLLATHVLDGSVGEAFFGEALRMHRDMLGDAAGQYIPTLLPN